MTDVVADFDLRERSLAEVLSRFSAGKEVPGSGSANALAAALAACLTASVAVKTQTSRKYIHVQQTAADVERRARLLADRLLDLLAQDSIEFARVVAIRRETGRMTDAIRQDDSLRREIAASKRSTEIPLAIGRIAAEVAELAVRMMDTGFATAKGESYTALAQALAAIDGALFVAQVNLRDIRSKAIRLNDPELEADWVRRMVRDLGRIRAEWMRVRKRETFARRDLYRTTLEAYRARKSKPSTPR